MSRKKLPSIPEMLTALARKSERDGNLYEEMRKVYETTMHDDLAFVSGMRPLLERLIKKYGRRG